MVIRAESTDPVRLPPPLCTAESAAPKVLALMSAAVQVSPQRSADPPCEMNVSLLGHEVPLARSVEPIVPPLTIRAAPSRTVPPLVFLSSHSTWMPWMVAVDGIEKLKPVHLRKCDAMPVPGNAAEA